MKTLKFFLMMLAVMMTTGMKAGNVQYLVLDLANGTQTFVALEDLPVVTCKGGELKVTVGIDVKVLAPLGEVAKYSFSESVPSALQDVVGEESRIEQGHVYITNAKKGDVVRVYTVNGRQVAQQRADDRGFANVDLSVLGQGLFIVKTSTTSIKVMNR